MKNHLIFLLIFIFVQTAIGAETTNFFRQKRLTTKIITADSGRVRDLRPVAEFQGGNRRNSLPAN